MISLKLALISWVFALGSVAAASGGLADGEPPVAQDQSDQCRELVGSSRSIASRDRQRRRAQAQVLSQASALKELALSNNSTVRMTHAGLIHSVAFQSLVGAAFERAEASGLEVVRSGDIVSDLKAMSHAEIEVFAKVLFVEMRQYLRAENPSRSPFENSDLARFVFFDLSEAELTDKLSEALLVTAENGFVDSSRSIAQAVRRSRRVGAVEAGLSMVSLIGAGLLAYITQEASVYYTYNMVTQFPDAIGFWSAVGLGVGGLVDGVRRLWINRGAQVNAFQQIVEGHEGIDRRRREGEEVIFYIHQNLSDRLKIFEDEAERVVELYHDATLSRREASSPFLGQADRVMELQKDLIQVFYSEFHYWIKMYDRSKGLVQSRFEKIRDGSEIVAPERQQEVVRFLDRSLKEALEGIELCEVIANGLHSVLQSELERLRNFDASVLGSLERSRFDSRTHDLSVTTTSVAMFRAQLANVHSLILQFNDQIAALGQAQILAITHAMGGQVSAARSGAVPVSIDDVLSTMKALDRAVHSISKPLEMDPPVVSAGRGPQETIERTSSRSGAARFYDEGMR